MMRKLVLLTVAASLAMITGHGAELSPEVRARAAKVLDALRMIESEQGRPSPGPRSMSFSEAEFNAWVAYRLHEEKEEFVKSAEFKLLANDRVEGRIVLDLGNRAPGGLLSPRQDIFFSARFETREGRIKIDMDSLFLGAQRLSPTVIDAIIAVVARLQGAEPTSLRDWYDLPPGVSRLETRPSRVIVIY